jgi:hypothetical protein
MSNTVARVRISTRSGEWAKNVSGLVAGLNWLATNESASMISGFEPAKLIVRTGAGATAITKTSRITRRRYKTRFQSSDQGYVVPFGTSKVAGNFRLFDTVANAIKALAPIQALRSVSIRNEIIKTEPDLFDYTGIADADNPNTPTP